MTAPTPPPEVQPTTDDDNPIHEPGEDVLYGRLVDGLPTPIYPELTVNKQPAVQTVQINGQVDGRA